MDAGMPHRFICGLLPTGPNISYEVLCVQNIDLSGCQLLTDRGIRALASSCPNLEAVNISSCYELSDAAFKLLGACSSLHSIDACGCERLTDRGLQALARGARYALGYHIPCLSPLLANPSCPLAH